jgi:hypothetical protein
MRPLSGISSNGGYVPGLRRQHEPGTKRAFWHKGSAPHKWTARQRREPETGCSHPPAFQFALPSPLRRVPFTPSVVPSDGTISVCLCTESKGRIDMPVGVFTRKAAAAAFALA